jgi:hypothetical protein
VSTNSSMAVRLSAGSSGSRAARSAAGCGAAGAPGIRVRFAADAFCAMLTCQGAGGVASSRAKAAYVRVESVTRKCVVSDLEQ